MNRADRKRSGRSLLCGMGAACTLLLVTGNIARGDTSNAPIDVGSRKQLFIDEKFIESITGVELVMNRPYQTGEVLITADKPWELEPHEGYINPYCSVLKDDGRIRVWYSLIQPTGSGPYDHKWRICYAESEDGLHFVKPELGLHEINGSKANNIVLPGVIGGCAVWIDPNAPPEHRYKTQAKTYPHNYFRMHSSPDGLQWKKFANINPRGSTDTQTVIFWDQRLKRYVFYSRDKSTTSEIDIRCRNVRRAEMTDLRDIKNTGLAIWPDALDRATYDVAKEGKGGTEWTPVDYYGATVFPYEEADRAYIMLAQAYWHWKRTPKTERSWPKITWLTEWPGTQDVQLAVSRDSKQFQRVGGRKPFLRLGPEGRFDSKWAWAMPNPIRMGDEIWIYYVGSNANHNGVVDTATTSGKLINAISRAVMRLDGFISADASYEGGELITPPLLFEGETLELNLDTSAGGSVRVELLDQDGKPIEHFTADEATQLNGNSVRMPVSWGENRDVSKLAGTPVKIRFIMRDCKLYAFGFKQ